MEFGPAFDINLDQFADAFEHPERKAAREKPR